MKQPIRYFSIGLIFASVTLFVVYQFFDQPESTLEDVEIDTLIATMNDHGYHVMEESEYIKLSVLQASIDEEDDGSEQDSEEDKKDQEKNEDTDKDDEKDSSEDDAQEDEEEVDEEVDEPTTITYTITIEPDMLPSDVSKILQEQDIIDDASAFNQFLENEDYSRLIQIGTFDVSSDMNDHELAEALTK